MSRESEGLGYPEKEELAEEMARAGKKKGAAQRVWRGLPLKF